MEIHSYTSIDGSQASSQKKRDVFWEKNKPGTDSWVWLQR